MTGAQEDWYARELPLDGAIVADVGANVGALSEFFHARVGPRGAVVSIEPLDEHRERLQTLASGAPRWRVESCAISARDGEIELFAARQAGVWSSVVAPGGGRVVPCRRLVSVVPDATVVKLDIEGHEYEVLDDSLDAMPDVAAWALELHMVTGRPLERALAGLSARGYALFAAGRRVGGGDAWVSAPIPPELSWSHVPEAGRRPDGAPTKMLHVLAKR